MHPAPTGAGRSEQLRFTEHLLYAYAALNTFCLLAFNPKKFHELVIIILQIRKLRLGEVKQGYLQSEQVPKLGFRTR